MGRCGWGGWLLVVGGAVGDVAVGWLDWFCRFFAVGFEGGGLESVDLWDQTFPSAGDVAPPSTGKTENLPRR